MYTFSNHDTDVGSTEKNAEPTKESTATKKDL